MCTSLPCWWNGGMNFYMLQQYSVINSHSMLANCSGWKYTSRDNRLRLTLAAALSDIRIMNSLFGCVKYTSDMAAWLQRCQCTSCIVHAHTWPRRPTSGGEKSNNVTLMRCPGITSMSHGASDVPQPVSAAVRLAR